MGMYELDSELVPVVAGGTEPSAGYELGHMIGDAYYGARDYLSETVYPYWADKFDDWFG